MFVIIYIEENYFSAFIKPEKVSNIVVSQEEYNVSRYYEEVNRTKYTKERKKQLSVLLGSSGGSVSNADTKSSSTSGSSKESDILEFNVNIDDANNDAGSSAAGDSGIFDSEGDRQVITEFGEANASEGYDGNDIHRSIFTDPLQTKPVKVDSYIRNDEQANENNTGGKSSIKEPEKVVAHITDNSSCNSSSSSSVSSLSSSLPLNNTKPALKNKHISPRTRLKDQARNVENVSIPMKKRSGLNRNLDSKLTVVLAKADGELDPIDECSVLIRTPKDINGSTADAPSCRAKLLSSSEGSNNDRSVTRD